MEEFMQKAMSKIENTKSPTKPKVGLGKRR